MDLEESHTNNQELVQDGPEEKEAGVVSKPETRRRSLSGSYGALSSSYNCNLCQITVNSQSQLAQVRERGREGCSADVLFAAHVIKQTPEGQPGSPD